MGILSSISNALGDFVGDIAGGVKDIFSSDIGRLVAGSAGFGVGGTTGAALATGNIDDFGDFGDYLGIDALGLMAGAGYTGALPGFSGAGNSIFGTSLVPGAPSTPDDIRRILQMGAGGPWSTAFAMGSGILGLGEARKMRQAAERAAELQDPFRGERGRYQAELRQLYDDPSRVERLPGYKAGLNAVERKMASQGYLGSGNMMLALHDYGGKAFDAEAQRLAVLAGGTAAPGGGTQLIEGRRAASDLASRSLASMGYGVRGLERLFQ